MSKYEESYSPEYDEEFPDKRADARQTTNQEKPKVNEESDSSQKKIRVEISLDSMAKEDGFENPFDIKILVVEGESAKEAVSLEDALKSAYTNMNGDLNLIRTLRQEVAKKFGFSVDSVKDRSAFESSVKKTDETMNRIVNDEPFRTEAPSDFSEEVVITGGDPENGDQTSKNKFNIFV